MPRSSMQHRLQGFSAAWTFLTVIPVPAAAKPAQQEDLGSGAAFFPLVGLLLGLLAWLGWLLLEPLFGWARGEPVLALLLVGLLLGLSGGLHLDGLSDAADGMLSARSRERSLEIMRDSRVGVMGLTAVVLVLVCKVLALAAAGSEAMGLIVLLMPLAGRTAILLQMALLEPARQGKGLATTFYGQLPKRERSRRALLAGLFFLLASWLAAGTAGLIASGAALLAAWLLALACRRRLGGATGDTLGASSEAAEAALALCFASAPVLSMLG